MKFSCCIVALAALSGPAAAFVGSPFKVRSSSSSLSMVLEKPKEKTISKLEKLKVESDYLIHPLKEVRTDCRFGCGGFFFSGNQPVLLAV